jgi:HlyD family secretion protein
VLSVPIIALTVREHETSRSGDSAAIALGREPTKQIGQRDVEGVFIVGTDNKVTFRPVRVGIAGEEYFEVVDGLQGGERIVAGSYQAIRELRDGAAVREAEQPTTPAAGAST